MAESQAAAGESVASQGDDTSHPPSPSASASPSIAASVGSTTVKWADQALEVGAEASHTVAQGLASGTKKLVGWETATQKQGLRPMHVRVAVRVHHVAFLHPGLDSGGRATIGDKSLKWRRFSKKKARTASPPGLLQFGSKKGSWKNPMASKNNPTGNLVRKMSDELEGVGGNGNKKSMAKRRKELEGEDSKDSSEIAEIISAEAFRLSRDGIIQHHYALNRALQQEQQSFDGQLSMYPGSVRKLGDGKSPSQSGPPGIPHSSMLSSYSAAHPEEAARYYKECAARPKGYRRLVVSSAVPTNDVPVPPPPTSPLQSPKLSGSRAQSSTDLGASKSIPWGKQIPGAGGRPEKQKQMRRTSTGTWSFGKDAATDSVGKDSKKDGAKDGKSENNLFDNVEYRYVGPPQTGPEFFQLLRSHGAATFGRYLPELACSVPNHSVGFELRKSSKRWCASTQPLVIEAPHVIWGDARDKMLSKIAEEGCPLIDSRSFEYVSNAALDDTQLSESLMVCGATLWVQNADADETVSSMSKLKPNYTKGMVKAEYYGGKFVDGIKGGLKTGGKGLAKGTKETIHLAEKGTKAIEKGTKAAVGGVEKLLPIPSGSESETTSAASTQAKEPRARKRDKLKAMFSPKRPKFGKRSKKEGDESVDGSVVSVGGESIATDAAQATGARSEAGSEADEGIATVEGGPDKGGNTLEREAEDEFAVVKPVPYTLLSDDVIDIRIVGFPDKSDVIANFPVSVASVMVQRSMEDRTNDPLKPSELTATFIQEPSAPLLRWGVELKVTLRAVEVHPQVPTVMSRPKDVIDEELRKMKDNLRMLGRGADEVKKELQEREDEIAQEQTNVDEAIVAYGYGRGENEGAGMKEVRRRQMFYCEREHSTITRKVKRRGFISEEEKKMLHDAKVDPSSQKKSYSMDQQTLLELLDLAFPRAEEDGDAVGDDAVSVKSETEESAEGDSNYPRDSLAKASLSLAKSLDGCLAGLTDKPTVPVVQTQLRSTFAAGNRPNVTRAVAKEWCSQVAERLSTHANKMSAADVNVHSSIATLQSIVAKSALGSEEDIGEGADFAAEETKLTEDEMASTIDVSGKVLDWATAVIIELEAYVADLDDDEQSLAYSVHEGAEEISGSTSGSVRGAVSGDPPGIPPPAPPMDSRQSSILSTESTNDPYEIVWQKILSQRGGSAPASNVASSGQRISVSISSKKDALPKSKSAPQSNIQQLLKTRHALTMSKKHGSKKHGLKKHDQSQQVNVQTSSLSATLVYLSVVISVFAVGCAVALLLFREAWAYFVGTV